MTARDRDAMVWRVLAALGIEDADLLPLGAGLASEAWRVGSVPTWYALRIARQWPDADSTFEMEHALMGLLAEAGARVPAPLRGSWQVADWSGPPFSLTLGLDGAPLAVADRARAVPGIAAFLRTLHGLTIDGYGPLTMVDGRLAGAASDMDGWAWAMGDAAALAPGRRAPGSAPGTRRASGTWWLGSSRMPTASARPFCGDPGVPLHSDLHDENILDDDGVPGFIDFGEALVGPAAWEFAALAYFLDWPTADAILAAYLDDEHLVGSWSRDAAAIGLCFGVYRWAQDRELEVDEDAHDEAFLVETLSRM